MCWATEPPRSLDKSSRKSIRGRPSTHRSNVFEEFAIVFILIIVVDILSHTYIGDLDSQKAMGGGLRDVPFHDDRCLGFLRGMALWKEEKPGARKNMISLTLRIGFGKGSSR